MPGHSSNETASNLGNQVVELARRHRFSGPAGWAAFEALRRGWGRMAQFDHPELGGMGQWSPSGMIMIGDMSNHDLKARVSALCMDLARLLAAEPQGVHASTSTNHIKDAGHEPPVAMSQSSDWWPHALGKPAMVGSQNGVRYAYFPRIRRLAIEQDGHLTVYDTGENQISGFSQQQGSSYSWCFVSQFGKVSSWDLRRVEIPD